MKLTSSELKLVIFKLANNTVELTLASSSSRVLKRTSFEAEMLQLTNLEAYELIMIILTKDD